MYLRQRQSKANKGTPAPIAPPLQPAPVRLGLICREGVNGEGHTQGRQHGSGLGGLLTPDRVETTPIPAVTCRSKRCVCGLPHSCLAPYGIQEQSINLLSCLCLGNTDGLGWAGWLAEDYQTGQRCAGRHAVIDGFALRAEAVIPKPGGDAHGLALEICPLFFHH